MKIDFAVEKALTGAKAKNIKAVKALLELGEAKLDKDGNVKGLDEQIEKLRSGDDTKFLFEALMAKMIAGSGNIDFTKVCSSSTQYTESQLQALTALSNIKQTTLVSKVTRTNEVAIKIDAAYSNVDLKEGYYMRTLGLYAVDPDKGEILYAVCIESQITVICHHITVLRYRLHTYSYIPQ